LCSATLFYKVAAGADAAPTIAAATSTVWMVQLGEFTGNAVVPLDQSGSAAGTTTPQVATCAAADATSGELFVSVGAARYTTTVTGTLTDTYNNGATATSTNNNATSAGR